MQNDFGFIPDEEDNNFGFVPDEPKKVSTVTKPVQTKKVSTPTVTKAKPGITVGGQIANTVHKPKYNTFVSEGVKPTYTGRSMRDLYTARAKVMNNPKLTHDQKTKAINTLRGQIMYREQNPLKDDYFGKIDWDAERAKKNQTLKKIDANPKLTKEQKLEAKKKAIHTFSNLINEDAKNTIRTDAITKLNQMDAVNQAHPYITAVNSMFNPWTAAKRHNLQHAVTTGNQGLTNDEGKADVLARTIGLLDAESKGLAALTILASPAAKGIGAVDATADAALNSGTQAINKLAASKAASILPTAETQSLNAVQKFIASRPDVAQNILNQVVNAGKNSAYGAVNMANLGLAGGIGDLANGATPQEYASNVGKMMALGGIAGGVTPTILNNMGGIQNEVLRDAITPVIDTSVFSAADLGIDRLNGVNDTTFGEKFAEMSPFLVPGYARFGHKALRGEYGKPIDPVRKFEQNIINAIPNIKGSKGLLAEAIGEQLPGEAGKLQNLNRQMMEFESSPYNNFTGEMRDDVNVTSKFNEDQTKALASHLYGGDKGFDFVTDQMKKPANYIDKMFEWKKSKPTQDISNVVKDETGVNTPKEDKTPVNEPPTAYNKNNFRFAETFEDMEAKSKEKFGKSYTELTFDEKLDIADDLWGTGKKAFGFEPGEVKEEVPIDDGNYGIDDFVGDVVNKGTSDKKLISDKKAGNKFVKELKKVFANDKGAKNEKYVPNEKAEPLPKPNIKQIKEVVPKAKTFKGKLKYSDYKNENFKLKKLKTDNTAKEENVRSTGDLDVTPTESDALDNGLTIKNVKNEFPDYVTDDPDFIEFYDKYRTADEKTKTKMLSDKLKSLGKEGGFDFYEKFTEQEQRELDKAKREYDQKYIDARNEGKKIMNQKKPKTGKEDIMPETERLVNTAKEENIDFRSKQESELNSKEKKGLNNAESLLHSMLPSKAKGVIGEFVRGEYKQGESYKENIKNLFNLKRAKAPAQNVREAQKVYDNLIDSVNKINRPDVVKREIIRKINEGADAFNKRKRVNKIKTVPESVATSDSININKLSDKIDTAIKNNDAQLVRDLIKGNKKLLNRYTNEHRNKYEQNPEEVTAIYDKVSEYIEKQINDKINSGDIEGAKELYNRTEKFLENYYTEYGPYSERKEFVEERNEQGHSWKKEGIGDTFNPEQSGIENRKTSWEEFKKDFYKKIGERVPLKPNSDKSKKLYSLDFDDDILDLDGGILWDTVPAKEYPSYKTHDEIKDFDNISKDEFLSYMENYVEYENRVQDNVYDKEEMWSDDGADYLEKEGLNKTKSLINQIKDGKVKYEDVMKDFLSGDFVKQRANSIIRANKALAEFEKANKEIVKKVKEAYDPSTGKLEGNFTGEEQAIYEMHKSLYRAEDVVKGKDIFRFNDKLRNKLKQKGLSENDIDGITFVLGGDIPKGAKGFSLKGHDFVCVRNFDSKVLYHELKHVLDERKIQIAVKGDNKLKTFIDNFLDRYSEAIGKISFEPFQYYLNNIKKTANSLKENFGDIILPEDADGRYTGIDVEEYASILEDNRAYLEKLKDAIWGEKDTTDNLIETLIDLNKDIDIYRNNPLEKSADNFMDGIEYGDIIDELRKYEKTFENKYGSFGSFKNAPTNNIGKSTEGVLGTSERRTQESKNGDGYFYLDKGVSSFSQQNFHEQGTVEEQGKKMFSDVKTASEIIDSIVKPKGVFYPEEKTAAINKDVKAIRPMVSNNLRKASIDAEKALINTDIITKEWAENRRKQLGVDAVHVPQKGHSGGTINDALHPDFDYEARRKVKKGWFGQGSDRKKDLTASEMAENIYSHYVRAKLHEKIMNTIMKDFAEPIKEGNGAKNGYVAVNKKLLSNLIFAKGSHQLYTLINSGEEAIKKAFKDEKQQQFMLDLYKQTRGADIQIPKVVYDRVLTGFGENARECFERYGAKNAYSYSKLASGLVDWYHDCFRRSVLGTVSFWAHNRVGDYSLILANRDNPLAVASDLIKARKISDLDISPKLIGNAFAETARGAVNRRAYLGYSPVDTALNFFGGQPLDTKYLQKVIKWTDHKGRVHESANSKYSPAKLWGSRIANLVSIPSRIYRKFAEKALDYNSSWENYERKAAIMPHVEKARKDLIKLTGQNMVTTEQAIRYIKYRPALEEAIVRQVEDVLGNYRTFSPSEKKLLKQFTTFGSWKRTVMRTCFQLAKKNPTRFFLILHELKKLKDNDDDYKEYQKGSLKTGVKDSRSGRELLSNLPDYLPFDDMTRWGENWQGDFTPLATKTIEAIRGKKFFGNGEIVSKRFAKVNTGKWDKDKNAYESYYLDTKTGKKYDKLPASERAKYWVKQVGTPVVASWEQNSLTKDIIPALFDKNRKVRGFKLPDKSYDTDFGGYYDGDFVNGVQRENYYNKGEKVKWLNRTSGLGLQPKHDLNKAEQEEAEKRILEKVLRQQEKMKKKKK